MPGRFPPSRLRASRHHLVLSLLACSLAVLCILGWQQTHVSGRVSLLRLNAPSDIAGLEADVAYANKLLTEIAPKPSRQRSAAPPHLSAAPPKSGASSRLRSEDHTLRVIQGRINSEKSQEESDVGKMKKAELVVSTLKAKVEDERSQRQADMDELRAEIRRAQMLVKQTHEGTGVKSKAGASRVDREMEKVSFKEKMDSKHMKLPVKSTKKSHRSTLWGGYYDDDDYQSQRYRRRKYGSYDYDGDKSGRNDPNDIARRRPNFDNPPPSCTTKPDPDECDRWKKQKQREIADYERDLRKSSDYSYEREARDRRYGYEPNIYNTVPQRYPHKDGADLGDNWISGFDPQYRDGTGDRYRSPRSRNSRHGSPLSEAGAFFGHVDRDRTSPLYSRDARLSAADKRRLQDQRMLQFAHSEYGSDVKSPLDPELRKMVWGDAADFMQDSFGYPSDTFPSTRQMKKQLMNTATKEVLEARYDRKKGFPRVTPLVERCKRTCSRCPFKEVLEHRETSCKEPDCTPGKCSKNDDPLTKQIAKGSLNGKADPFGFQSELEDEELPEQLVAMHRNPLDPFSRYGEPITDAIVRGWDMHNGIDFQKAEDS
ncbi:hypothetical protein GUITHDRAFT_100015 [Guillardia theta CCMP2712]|uniref:Uncharacterized protein n=1 Tax=Guillardia theta (strain CCMP2712) TaxID=905079 RepID=L1K1T1_GUITC|nr:hypothetical protein GUITHDRAFT_100015 [Guillardia theta CCMP2712]EKX54539.1 hypothetical protein GUITHDRAFT_100015 [Guillardia theta CCMP2712]|eukprot:XP_005841519.1 hypothetical protein GUITHDRAFT_100015 [Guillardia theta CCMP2712]